MRRLVKVVQVMATALVAVSLTAVPASAQTGHLQSPGVDVWCCAALHHVP